MHTLLLHYVPHLVQYQDHMLHPALYNLQYDGFVKECKEKGLKLHVWTVNEREYMQMCCQFGVDAIITNYPDVAREVVGA